MNLKGGPFTQVLFSSVDIVDLSGNKKGDILCKVVISLYGKYKDR